MLQTFIINNLKDLDMLLVLKVIFSLYIKYIFTKNLLILSSKDFPKNTTTPKDLKTASYKFSGGNISQKIN